ncbi:MAG: hypothetical protein K8S27_12280, partial [Candidatus Omnitrophica bacterium]|nr:hypothetical protein [Candidatus Omnitrophota bacterium]
MDMEDGITCRPDCTVTCGDGICQADEGHVLCQTDCPSPTCGDGFCSAMDMEDGITCRPDCTVTCGDGICQADEGHVLCQTDCPSPTCGDGFCSAMDMEDGITCRPDCTVTCGDGICQADEGHVLCQTDCPSPTCGDGFCSAMDMEDGITCRPDCTVTCGNGLCEPDEGHALCQMDCPSPLCGDGYCSAIDGEDSITCQPDCGTGFVSLLEAVMTPDAVTHSSYTINFVESFAQTPIVLAAMVTTDGGDAAATRITSVSEAQMQLFIEEEKSRDAEISHTTEVVGFIALEEGDIQNDVGVVIGESGRTSASQANGNQWHTVALDNNYTDPVVIMNTTTQNDAEPCHIRIRNVTPTSFEYQIEEWDYQDQAHGLESMTYIVMEKGAHQLFNGDAVVVGTASVKHRWITVSLLQPFGQAPLVLTQSQTRNGGDAIVTRVRAVSTTTFRVKLQEQESKGSHVFETIGYIAIQQ